MRRRTRGRGAELDEIEAVYRGRLSSFRRVAAAVVGDRELALDVVQEAFGSAVRNRSAFRGHGSLEGWLWRIVVNTARDYRARSGDVPSGIVDHEPAQNGATEHADA